ncbi:MAG: prenyltransferase/squalene oxidase repeat-containing protein [Rhodopirellula sp. JB044]|uniref:prenyltransferase/squalene oxidase repeat-containing protein n=1 Tax=Rhodopirellula sp. JB044 TaxID=3342844 RepID=UPI00370C3110
MKRLNSTPSLPGFPNTRYKIRLLRLVRLYQSQRNAHYETIAFRLSFRDSLTPAKTDRARYRSDKLRRGGISPTETIATKDDRVSKSRRFRSNARRPIRSRFFRYSHRRTNHPAESLDKFKPMSGYLNELTMRLAVGASLLPAELRSRHAHWLRKQQRADGGFAGREGDSDPYYTAFALRALWILGELDESIGQASARFLRQRMTRRDSVIDLISLIFASAIVEMATGVVVISDDDADWRHNVAATLSTLRCDDGGFAKTPEGRAGSTYQTFLTVLCHELMDVPVADTDSIAGFLSSQQHVDGGFLEIRVAKRAGVNPTAAAIGTMKTLGFLDPAEQIDTAEFVADMQSDEGGFTANTRIPFADLLSSFTALTTLVDLDETALISVPRVQRYAESMQSPEGGFVGFTLDQVADVEYTFYGLGTLSLCAALTADS